MSWQRAAGAESNHIDGRTGVHHIRLENTATGGEHLLHIRLGTESCPQCKRPYTKDSLGAVDPKAVVAEAMTMLQANHAAVLAYAERHGVPIKTALIRPTAPEHYRTQRAGVGSSSPTMLIPPGAKR